MINLIYICIKCLKVIFTAIQNYTKNNVNFCTTGLSSHFPGFFLFEAFWFQITIFHSPLVRHCGGFSKNIRIWNITHGQSFMKSFSVFNVEINYSLKWDDCRIFVCLKFLNAYVLETRRGRIIWTLKHKPILGLSSKALNICKLYKNYCIT